MKLHVLVAQTAKNIRRSIQPFLFLEFTSYKIAYTYNTTYNMFQVDCKIVHMLDRKVDLNSATLHSSTLLLQSLIFCISLLEVFSLTCIMHYSLHILLIYRISKSFAIWHKQS
ncbi:unnamed protein product [Musa textilis]